MKNKGKILFIDPIVYDNKFKIFETKFNPVNDDLAVVDLKGKLRILKINNDNDNENIKVKNNFSASKNKESIYCVDYSLDGKKILCGTFDGELIIIENNKVYMRNTKAHEKSINKVKFINENLFCSSDFNGEIKIFDIRTKEEIFKFNEQEEEITDFEYNQDTSFLLSTSIDGTLGVYDIRKVGKYKLYALSDNIEDELTSMKLIKNGQKVACGTSEGPIVVFNWDWFGDYKDRILGHPASVNCLA
jgi:WD40 repeat protein